MSSNRKQLTDKQQAFLQALFDDECKGNFRCAMNKAGYAKTANANQLARDLADEITARARAVMSQNSAQAAFAFGNVLNDPTQMGAKEKMIAAEKILDRVGIVKEDTVNVNSQGDGGFVFILPAKNEDTEDE